MNKGLPIIIYFSSTCILLFMAIFFPLSSVQAEWMLNGEPVFNSTYAKTDGEFGAMLEFTDKPSELFEAWNKEDLTVKGSFVDKIKRNKTLVAVIIFSNCTANDKGMANVAVRFQLFDPKGNLITTTDELEVWINKPVPKYRDLEMGVQYLAVKLKKKDPLGLYTVKATVLDKNSGKELNLEREFKLL